MHESFQERGISQQAAQSLLQDLDVLEGALEQEVAEKLGGSRVAEKGQIKTGGIAEKGTQLLLIPSCSCGSHCNV